MSSKQQKTPSANGKALVCMILLTVQFGCQPMLTRTFTPSSICKSTVILVQEIIKFVLAMGMLLMSGEFKSAVKGENGCIESYHNVVNSIQVSIHNFPFHTHNLGWSISSWIKIAVVPAGLYTVQNTAALMAYQNLDGVTFNVLNQTKTLSAAICCYLLLGKRQSKVQILSLIILFISALTVQNLIPLSFLYPSESGEKSKSGESYLDSSTSFTQGVLPVLLASFISGLAGAISQKNLQNEGRNPYLFSSELCVASILALSISLLFSADGEKIRSGFFDQWTLQTLIPVFTNAVGGIVVGLVTKYAGSVRKGFALIFGMILTGVVQSIKDGLPLSPSHIVGGCLAACSLWMHSTNPYQAPVRQKQD